MDYLQKQYANYILKPFLKRYLRKERYYQYKNIKLKIYPGVFHPKYFFSSLMFAEFVEKSDLHGKYFCEIGAGSGLMSFIAYTKNAVVDCIDINATAIKGVKENLLSNFTQHKDFHFFQSDLFNTVPHRHYDVVVVNPPYFFKRPNNMSEYAWYCGENGEFFEKMFSQLPRVMHEGTEVYMILADNCEIERITQMARQANFNMVLSEERKIKWEKNFIFKLNLLQRGNRY